MKMTKQERLRAVLAMLRDGGLTTAIRVGDRFGVSTATVLRDFDALRAEGHRIEGCPGIGGGTMLRRAKPEGDFDERP